MLPSRLPLFTTLRGRFFAALVLVGVLPFILLSILLLRQERRVLQDWAEVELGGLARGYAGELDARLADVQRDAQAIAALPAVTGMNSTRQAEVLVELADQYPLFTRLAIADLSGRIRMSSDLTSDSAGRDPAPPAGILDAFPLAGAQGIYVNDDQPDDVTLDIYTPLFQNDRHVGLLIASVALDSLAAPLTQAVADGTTAIALLDGDGDLLMDAGPPASEGDGNVGTTVHGNNALLTTGRLPGENSLGARYVADGEAYFAGVAPLAFQGWTVVVERPERAVLAPVYRSGNIALWMEGTLLLLSLFLGYIFADGLTRPVHELAHAVRALGDGDAQAPLPPDTSGIQELDSLVDSFDRMRAAVSAREQSLQQSEARMRSVVDALPDCLIRMDPNNVVLAAHGPLDVLDVGTVDAAALSLVGRRFDDLADHFGETSLFAAISQCMHSMGVARGLHVREFSVDQDGRHADFEVRCVAGDEGERLLLIRDTTEEKRTQDALLQAQKMESLGVLAGGIAHDFNNLLTSMMGQTSLALLKLPPDSEVRPHIDRAVRSAERAADLTMQMLAYAGKGQFYVQLLDLNELLRENAALLDPALPQHVTLVLELTGEPLSIQVDKAQIQQVVMNLVINAAESIDDPTGFVRISTAAETLTDAQIGTLPFIGDAPVPGRYACVTVTDSGCGMSEATLAHIFDPFFSTKSQGSGLGLSATLGIIQTHQGGIQVASELGRGSTFRIYLPLASTVSVPAAARIETLESVAATVLVVDDQAPVRIVAEDILTELGATVLTAESGAEALEIYTARGQEIDLVLLDIMMPGVDGKETLRRLQAMNPEIYVVLSSGYTVIEAEALMAHSRTVRFLQKPYETRKLMAVLREFEELRALTAL